MTLNMRAYRSGLTRLFTLSTAGSSGEAVFYCFYWGVSKFTSHFLRSSRQTTLHADPSSPSRQLWMSQWQCYDLSLWSLTCFLLTISTNVAILHWHQSVKAKLMAVLRVAVRNDELPCVTIQSMRYSFSRLNLQRRTSL